jgi:hypothetical protein
VVGVSGLASIACWALASMLITLVAAPRSLPTTSAFLSGSIGSLPNTFVGATFVPSVAPTAGATTNNAEVLLSWDPVSVTSGATVSYKVARTDSNGVVAHVCLGGDAPTTNAGKVGCADRSGQAEAIYSYAITPVVVRNGVDTWSRPPGASSNQVVVPRIAYASTGAVVTSTTNRSISVPYPSGTQPGDVLVLVSVTGRNSTPSGPSGWTQLARVSRGGANALGLLVAWRLADAGQSVLFNPLSNSSGSASYVMRFSRVSGNSAVPAMVTPAVSSGTAAASAQLIPSPDPSTTGTNAVVVSIVAARSVAPPTPATAGGFALGSAGFAAAGSASLGWGVATTLAIPVGQVALPQWTQVGSPGPWAHAAFAFR